MADIDWLAARPIAHRGYHKASAGRIENTLPAFEAAVGRGFAVECDVHETADGEVAVFHDDALDRLTEGSGPLAARTLPELRSLRFRGTAARIPSLEDLLDLADGRVPLVIELKTGQANAARLAMAVAARLSTYDGPVGVMAFEPETMVRMRQIAPQIPRGMLIDAFSQPDYPALSAPSRFALRHMLATPFVGPSFVGCAVSNLTASAPRAARHFFTLPVLAWTVRTPGDRALAEALADQIIFEGFDPTA